MLKVIGAGLPRTGTTSLKAALEQLLGGGCYHMFEFFERVDEHGALWWRALEGDLDALDAILDGWTAAIDWPASLFWRELSRRHPEATVVLSHRDSAETWWKSVDRTVWASMRVAQGDPLVAAWNAKLRAAFGLGDDWDDASVAIAAYRRHFDDVVATVPAERLVVWQATDGWEPLCGALGIDVASGGVLPSQHHGRVPRPCGSRRRHFLSPLVQSTVNVTSSVFTVAQVLRGASEKLQYMFV